MDRTGIWVKANPELMTELVVEWLVRWSLLKLIALIRVPPEGLRSS